MNAIVGASGSGKSALGLALARKFKLDIFSIDSLSVYKYIDIASAKPTKSELSEIRHYGIDVLEPSEKCNVMLFFNMLQELKNRKNILIVGGSGFYLKSIINGLSNIPQTPAIIMDKIHQMLSHKEESYHLLKSIDFAFAKTINPNDTYRIQKSLELFFLTGEKPSVFYHQNPPKKLDVDIKIFELLLPKDELVSRIIQRVENMLDSRLVDEVENLVAKYPNSQANKAIGIKEILAFLDGQISLNEAKELIIKNTIALSKRQKTFNRTQFNAVRGNYAQIYSRLEMEYNASLL